MEVIFKIPKKLEPLAKKFNKIRNKILHKLTENRTFEDKQKVFWKDDCVIEFWLDGFNGEGLDVAFLHIVKIYDTILCNDTQWHYFYEDSYSLIRCSYKYVYKVKKYLDDNNIKYKWPVKNWVESTYMTMEYQDIYKEIFHNLSILIIQMFKKGDGAHLELAGDRIIHPFFNHALYLAEMDGQLEPYRENGLAADLWEGTKMSNLSNYRSYHIGLLEGQCRVVNYYENKQKKGG